MKHHSRYRSFLVAGVLGALFPVVSVGATVSAPVAPAPSARERLVALKGAIMRADYEADLPRLATLEREASRLTSDAELGYLAQYWAGFASWRAALNGVNKGMDSTEIRRNLEKAALAFRASSSLREDFADALAAEASVHGWLCGFVLPDTAAFRSHAALSTRNVEKALALEPANPRVLWVQAGNFLFRPVGWGGDPPRAIRIYRQIIASAPPLDPGSPLPDWGKPEAMMALAFGLVNATSPDYEESRKAALEALELQPRWSYVRNVLLPQIEQAAHPPSAPAINR